MSFFLELLTIERVAGRTSQQPEIPRSAITATINNNATQLVETRPGIFTQIFSSKAPSYQVILSTPDGARTTMNLAGCP